jgi:hypothetical protein
MKKITVLLFVLLVSINPVACMELTQIPYQRLHSTIVPISHTKTDTHSSIKSKKDDSKRKRAIKIKTLPQNANVPQRESMSDTSTQQRVRRSSSLRTTQTSQESAINDCKNCLKCELSPQCDSPRDDDDCIVIAKRCRMFCVAALCVSFCCGPLGNLIEKKPLCAGWFNGPC